MRRDHIPGPSFSSGETSLAAVGAVSVCLSARLLCGCLSVTPAAGRPAPGWAGPGDPSTPQQCSARPSRLPRTHRPFVKTKRTSAHSSGTFGRSDANGGSGGALLESWGRAFLWAAGLQDYLGDGRCRGRSSRQDGAGPHWPAWSRNQGGFINGLEVRPGRGENPRVRGPLQPHESAALPRVLSAGVLTGPRTSLLHAGPRMTGHQTELPTLSLEAGSVHTLAGCQLPAPMFLLQARPPSSLEDV